MNGTCIDFAIDLLSSKLVECVLRLVYRVTEILTFVTDVAISLGVEPVPHSHLYRLGPFVVGFLKCCPKVGQ